MSDLTTWVELVGFLGSLISLLYSFTERAFFTRSGGLPWLFVGFVGFFCFGLALLST